MAVKNSLTKNDVLDIIKSKNIENICWRRLTDYIDSLHIELSQVKMMNKHEQEMIEQYWDEAHEKMLESVLVNNEELRGLFETYPERKEEYKFKILDSEVLEAPTPPTKK